MPKNVINTVNYPTVADALKRAEEQKVHYEKNLLNKRFIYAFVGDNNQIDFKEVVFKKSSYLHLTGLDYKGKQSKKRQGISISGTDALNFYKRLGTDATLINDVSFTQGNTVEETQRYFGYTQHKLDNLSQLTQLSNKAEFIGKYKGDRDFDIIVNRNFSSLALFQDKKIYLPASLLFGNPQKVATNLKPIIAIFSREKDTRQFTIQYLNKNISLKNAKMAVDLSQRLNTSSFENKEVSFNRNQLNKLVSIYTSSIKYDFTKQLTELSSKREKAFNSEADMNEYIKAFNRFKRNVNEDYKKDIAIELLSKEAENNTNSLIADETSAIKEKFGLSTPALSAPTTSKPMQMSITEDKPMQIDFSMQGGAAAMTLNPQMPNNEFFTRIANTIAKGVDSLLHKKSDTKRTQAEASDRQQPTPQQSENKTSTPTKALASQPAPQKQSLKAMMSKAAQQKKDMAAATKSMEKWADDVQDIQQSRKNNIHR